MPKHLTGSSFEDARLAAAKIFGTTQNRIGLELDTSTPGKQVVVVNFQESMKHTSETRQAVKAAVQAALPPDYAHCKVTVV